MFIIFPETINRGINNDFPQSAFKEHGDFGKRQIENMNFFENFQKAVIHHFRCIFIIVSVQLTNIQSVAIEETVNDLLALAAV
jgi:hypothetical protein